MTLLPPPAYMFLYRRRILEAYPKGDDGSTLFPFRRLFMVATAA